jgi:hypothetical protein
MPQAVLVIGWSVSVAQPAVDRTRASKKRQPSGQLNGCSSAAPSRHLCSTSLPLVLRRM